MRGRLDASCARVSVIGQVKAGKSSFIHAFIGQPRPPCGGGEPLDLGRHQPADQPARRPAGGTSFRFFDNASWGEIVNGGPKIRRLAKDLPRGFDGALLVRQAQDMRDRARVARRFCKTLRTVEIC